MTAPRPAGDGEARACLVVMDGFEDDVYLVCLTCDPGREVCCGHHLAPHDENGCHELVGKAKCACERRPASPPAGAEANAEPAPPTDGLREELARWWAGRHDLCDLDFRYADQVLALPGIQRLLAAEQAVARVRALADRYDQLAIAFDEGPARVLTRSAADRIRRALDGES